MNSDQLNKLHEIKNNGHLVFIKFDGARSKNQITTFIDFPENPGQHLIRANGDDLEDVLNELFLKYDSRDFFR